MLLWVHNIQKCWVENFFQTWAEKVISLLSYVTSEVRWNGIDSNVIQWSFLFPPTYPLSGNMSNILLTTWSQPSDPSLQITPQGGLVHGRKTAFILFTPSSASAARPPAAADPLTFSQSPTCQLYSTHNPRWQCWAEAGLADGLHWESSMLWFKIWQPTSRCWNPLSHDAEHCKICKGKEVLETYCVL